MPETPESLLNIVNASGFLFQLRVEQEIKALESVLPPGSIKVIAGEHRWVDPTDGAEGFIDLILEQGICRMVIECKRVSDATWVFLIPDDRVKMHRAQLLWTASLQSGAQVAEWHDFALTPPSPEAAFCVVRGQGEKDTPMLERISSLMLRSLESLANEEMNQARQGRHIYYPVMITNATLQVCRFNPCSVDLATGRIEAIDAAGFQEVPFVRFRKNLSSTLASKAPPADLQTANQENERTVFVINANHLIDTLKEWDVPYGMNAPWPWEKLNA